MENDLCKDAILLMDADILAHRCACVAEKTWYLATDEYNVALGTTLSGKNLRELKGELSSVKPYILWSRVVDKGPEFAKEVLQVTIKSIIDKLSPSRVEYFLSPPKTFRNDVAMSKPYKGSREGVPRPKHLKILKEMLINEYGAKIAERIEADDSIGIRHTELGDRAVGTSVIVSIDKDMDQLEGWHFDWVKDKLYRISRREADFNLFTQVLCGDATDDIPGLPGVGPVQARKILSPCKSSRELYERCWDAFRNGGHSYEYFVEQYRLVYILRKRATWDLGGVTYGLEGNALPSSPAPRCAVPNVG